MDIQVDTPPSLPLRHPTMHTGRKRLRSPSSGRLVDRPQKRRSSGVEDSCSSWTALTDTNSSCCEEDYAQTAKSTRLISKGTIPNWKAPPTQSPAQPEIDEDTAMAEDDDRDIVAATVATVFFRPTSIPPYSEPQMPLPHASSFPTPIGRLSSFSEYQEPTSSAIHTSNDVSSELQSFKVMQIRVQPPVPQVRLDVVPSMACPPPHGRSSSALPPSPRKSSGTRGLTMGPRVDCEKCRMRVPGHWMHFD